MNLADLLSGGYGGTFGTGFGGGTNNLFNNGGGQTGGGFLSNLFNAIQQGQNQGIPTNAPLNSSAPGDMQSQGLFGAGTGGAFGGGGSLFGNNGGLDSLNSNSQSISSPLSNSGLKWLYNKDNLPWLGNSSPQNTGQATPTPTAPSTPIFNSRPLTSVRPFGAVY